MNATETNYLELFNKITNISENMAREIVNNGNDNLKMQLYLIADVDDNSDDNSNDVNFLLRSTTSLLETNKNTFLLHSESARKYSIQQGLDFFDNTNYKEKAKELIIEMVSENISNSAKTELRALKDMKVFNITEKNEDILIKLDEVGLENSYNIFTKQYLNSLEHPILRYEPHPIIEELINSDHSTLEEKYNLKGEELEFLQVASKIPIENLYELVEKFIEPKTIVEASQQIKSLNEFKNSENLKKDEETIMYFSNIISTVYDLYNLPYSENGEDNLSISDFKDAAEHVINVFSDNNVSLFHVINSMKENNGITQNILNEIKQGFMADELINDNQLSFNFDEETKQDKVEIKIVNPSM